MKLNRGPQATHIRQFIFGALNPWRAEPLLEKETWDEFEQALVEAPKIFDRRVFWHVNSTAAGGGVAEMLNSLLPYMRGAGIDVRWMIILGDEPFFAVTKRLHNLIHGSAGDGGEMGEKERAAYEKITFAAAEELMPLVQSNDVLILHDPQTAGMIPLLKKKNPKIIWRSHIGIDSENAHTKKAWEFLQPYLKDVDAFVFTREKFVPKKIKSKSVFIIPPSIDPISPKNQPMEEGSIEAILSHTGLLRLTASDHTEKRFFHRMDGSPARVDRWCDVLRAGPPPEKTTPLVVQVSRWDRLKDPVGVMKGFAEHVGPRCDAHLLLVGPDVQFVADDPEGLEVLGEVEEEWRSLPVEIRSRIALACVPMRDLEENAAIINAIQRHASVVVQKSLAEGFGLTVTEAMWKGPPIVASAVGGIQDQIEHGKTGLLIDDPRDLKSFGKSVLQLLENREDAKAIGEAAQKRAQSRFLFNRHLKQYFELVSSLIS